MAGNGWEGLEPLGMAKMAGIGCMARNRLDWLDMAGNGWNG